MVSLEIPYYPCMFGQTKSVPGIKYRILGDGENNYYESFKSVVCLLWFCLCFQAFYVVRASSVVSCILTDMTGLLNQTK